MSRRLIGVAAVVAAALVFAPTASAQSGGGCQLDGTASFSPGLSTSAQDFTYAFGGDLTGCQSSTAGAPATGTVSAGNVYTDATGQQFQEPRSTGNGGCANSTTSGIAIVTWADGTRTIVDYDTTGAAAAVHLSRHRAAERDAAGDQPAARPADLDDADDDALRRILGARPAGLRGRSDGLQRAGRRDVGRNRRGHRAGQQLTASAPEEKPKRGRAPFGAPFQVRVPGRG